jgi:hypothetical protein
VPRERQPRSGGKPKAPTIAAQIEEAKAPTGSALEKLIRANQDFDLLHPDEFEDEYPVPLWLRVAWRKQHPEVQMPAKNPGAAYPEVLSQVYRRMVASPRDAWGPGATQGAEES